MTHLVERSRETLPVVPLRDMVVFPHMMAPFIVGRESSVRALESALGTPGRRIYLVAQRDPKVDEPVSGDLFDVGVVARVVQNLKLPNGNIKVMVEGAQRARLLRLEEREGTSWADVEVLEVRYPHDEKVQAFMASPRASSPAPSHRCSSCREPRSSRRSRNCTWTWRATTARRCRAG